MRFVGALAVVVTHVSFQTGQYGDGVRGTVVARLDSGVALFFVLSGFLLSRPFFSRMAFRRELPHVGFYAWKRALRIVPVYVITVVLVLSLIPRARAGVWPRWVENLTMTVIYTPGTLPDGLTQMWSLATEVAFYVILPFLMIAIARTACRRRWSPRPILGLLLGLCVVNFVWLSSVSRDGDHILWLPAFLTWFSVGMTLSVASVDLDTRSPLASSRALARLGGTAGSCLVAAAAVLLIASTPVAGPVVGDVPTAAEAITKNILYALFGFLVIAPGVFGSSDSAVLRMLTWAPLRYLGRISYGIFCIHLLVLYEVFAWRGFAYFDGHFLEVLVLALTGSVAASAALHVWVENPTAGLRRLGRPKTEQATTPSVTAIIT